MSKRSHSNDARSRPSSGHYHDAGPDRERHEYDEQWRQEQPHRQTGDTHYVRAAPTAGHQHSARDEGPKRQRQEQPRNQMPDRVEEVWLKEKGGRISFNDSDLVNVERAAPRNSKFSVAGVAGVMAMLALIGFLAFSSAPELEPHEIIAMRGYEGEQATKTPFNLASLRDCNDIEACGETMKPPVSNIERAVIQPAQNTNQATIADAIVDTPIATPVATVEAVTENTTSSADGYAALQEIPAATVLPTFNTTPVAEENPTQLRVLKQWSNVRSSPNVNSTILTSLAVGTNVTLLRQTGEWFEVSAFKRKEFIGYMHRSTVEVQ